MNKELEAVLNRLDLFNLDIKKNIEDIYNRLYITFDDNEISYLLDYIEELKKENNKLNHYKKLYQSVKKQKDNVIGFIEKLDKECEKDGCSFVNLIEVLKILEILEVCDLDE